MQETFIKYIKSKTLDNTPITELVASVLDINYDAAYRRLTGKISLSLEEGVMLAKHFNVSLNKLYEIGEQNTVLIDTSVQIKDEKGLENYFKTSLENLLPVARLKSASILYSAKDIPLFYTLKDSYLIRYKIYVWLKLINEGMAENKTSI